MADPNVRAKRHAALQKFTQEVRKGFMSKTVEIQGTKFLLQTPTEDDVIWSDSFIRPATPLSFASSRRAPRLAVALKEINGVKLEDLFSLDDSAKPEEIERLKDPIARRYWLQTQLMLYLVDEVPPPLIEKLYSEYESLIKDRDQVLQAVVEDPNALTRTPGSAAAPS